jgi:hypothetical protein
MTMKNAWLTWTCLGMLAGGAGCAEDPQYIGAPMGASFALEFNGAAPAPMVVTLPFRQAVVDDPVEVMRRTDLATELGLAVDQIPYVRLDDVDLSVEWSMKNLEDCDAQVTFMINGGNQYFSYDPAVLQPDPDEPQPPPLLGRSAPIPVPASGLVTGVFREDQVLEASIDLELITRANYNPFRAGLEVNKDMPTVEIYSMPPPPPPGQEPAEPMPTGMFLPREAWGLMTSFSMAFDAQTTGQSCGGTAPHLVFEFTFRARDHERRVHEEGLDAPAGELIPYMPAVYGAMAPPP